LPFDAKFRRITVTRYLGPAGGGGSGAQAFADAEGNQYVVKFKENGQGLRVLANELVANKLALFLQVPVPEGFIIDVPQELIGVTPAIGKDRPNGSISVGPHFGVKRLDPWRNPPPDALAKVKNKDDVPNIFVFDVLTLNTDRKPEHLLVVRPDFDHTGHYVSAIDHGHCFGSPTWDASIAQRGDQDNLQITAGLMECVVGHDPFKDGLETLGQLDRSIIDQIVGELPDEWGVSPEEKVALATFIETRKTRVEKILLSHRQHFPKWTQE